MLNVFLDVFHGLDTARIHVIYLMKMQPVRLAVSDPKTKPRDLGCNSASVHIHHHHLLLLTHIACRAHM